MVSTISTRLAAATSFTDELREECARLCGWYMGEHFTGLPHYYYRETDDRHAPERYPGLPKLDLTEIVAEIERRGWLSGHTTSPKAVEFDVYNGMFCRTATRPDRNIQLCAMTALAMAIEGEK